MHERAIEPRSPTWQARILPLNHSCGVQIVKRATLRNHSEPLNKERLQSSCLRQDGIVCQVILVRVSRVGAVFSAHVLSGQPSPTWSSG